MNGTDDVTEFLELDDVVWLAGRLLVDGNKRLGWLATAVFLEINGAGVAAATNDEVYELVMSVASGRVDLEGIARALEQFARAAGR